mmetsp:Transcript_26158/g.72147  ORF Transcript_26158/g.72147 Transcript_26158/m.72147 type:complete len:256 (-) Transcript_26158:169-936(-)
MNANLYRLVSLALAWGAMVDGFISTRFRPQTLPVHTRVLSLQRRQAHVDPNAVLQHVNDLAAAPHLLQHQHANLESLLSTMYTSGVAHGHSNPWFGPPDPILEAGKSVVPATRDAASTTSPDALPQLAQQYLDKGWKIVDNSLLTPEKDLPGMTTTGGHILPARKTLPLRTDTVDVVTAQVEWAASYMNVALKLPLAAFFYVLVEFFFLRSNVDMYKEDIEQESQTALWADTLATIFVRMIAMSVVAILTLTVFG